MKKIAILSIAAACAIFAGCHKSSTTTTTPVTETQVLNDFVNKIALPEYANLQVKATALNTAVATLNSSPTDANLAAAQQAWRDVRTSWETCEGFLFGPVEDNNYDPNTDSWPVSYVELDSLIGHSSSLNVATIQTLNQNLRGYHPLEFILWGQTGNATAASLTAADKQYMVALSQDILNNIDSLNYSWSKTGGDFQDAILQINTRYTSKQQIFLAIIGSISDICHEVGSQSDGGKIHDPLAALDSFQTESPFSHNSMTDFKNNIIGAQNAYLCTYNGTTGASISALVATKNLSLDNTIKAQFAAAIGALDNVTVTFESAIFTQQTQLRTAMSSLNTLQATLDGDLTTFIMTNLKD